MNFFTARKQKPWYVVRAANLFTYAANVVGQPILDQLPWQQGQPTAEQSCLNH